MKCGHDLMIDQPGELAAILEGLGRFHEAWNEAHSMLSRLTISRPLATPLTSASGQTSSPDPVLDPGRPVPETSTGRSGTATLKQVRGIRITPSE
jgi:hypothetical protein